MKKLNCNPGIMGKTATKNTCYTVESLKALENAFDNNNKIKIKSKSPNSILEELRNKFSTSRDNDWFQQLRSNDRKKIEKESFAPNKPNEWKNNPKEWLSIYDMFLTFLNNMKKHI